MRDLLSVVGLLLAVSLAGCVAPNGLLDDHPPEGNESPPKIRPRASVAGTLVSTNRSGDEATFVVDAEIVDCEAVDRRISRTANVSRYEERGDSPRVDELREGETVVVDSRKPRGSDRWHLVGIDRNLTRHRSQCRDRHAYDLWVRAHTGPVPFDEGETRTVTPAIFNRQDDTLTLTIDEAYVVNRTRLQDRDHCGARPGPSGEPRREDDGECPDDDEEPDPWEARIEDCSVQAPADVEIPGNGSADVDLDVTCERSYSEDQVKDLGIWANASFVDELGGDHPLEELFADLGEHQAARSTVTHEPS